MLRLFNRKRSSERAFQWTEVQRRILETPGIPPAGLPYSTYDEMELDPMIQTSLTIKRLGVIAPSYKVIPGADTNDGRKAVQLVQDSFARLEGSPLTILEQAMDAFSKGWSVQEIVWQTDGRRTWIEAVRPKDPQHFGVEIDAFGRLIGLKLQVPGEPQVSLPRENFAVFTHRSNYHRIKGRSDLDAAWRHWVMKNQLISAWKVHLERFAMPTLLGKFQRGLPSAEQSAVLSALQGLHRTSAIVLPSEVEVSTIGGDKDPSTGFMEALEFHNREIARAILGQTLTTDEGRRVGSLALGRVHLQVLVLQLEATRRHLADSVMTEQIIRPLVEMNMGRAPIPRFEFDSVSLGAFATGDIGSD